MESPFSCSVTQVLHLLWSLKRRRGKEQEGILEEEEEEKSVARGVVLFSSLAKSSPQDSLEYVGGS
jgi:hypothetical protein